MPTSSKSPSKESHSKLNQDVSGKNQGAQTQHINKENCSKNFDSTKTTLISQANNVQSCTTKTHSDDKQVNISPNQSKVTSRTMPNLNISISNESNSNNIGSKTTGNPPQSVTTSRQVSEPPTNNISTKAKLPTSLKILSSDEVNRKYVQIQVKNDTNERLVTINDKVTLNNKTVINRDENISGSSKDITNKDVHDHVLNQLVESVEKDVTTTNTQSDNNNTIDSNASTVILTKENPSIENLDTSESTIHLSQCEKDSQASLILNTENKDDSTLSLTNNNVPDDKRNIVKNWLAIKKDVKTELNALTNLPRTDQEKYLKDTEQKLILKR